VFLLRAGDFGAMRTRPKRKGGAIAPGRRGSDAAEGLQNPWKEIKGPRGRKSKSFRKENKADRKENKARN
jgi:hypothetical protein